MIGAAKKLGGKVVLGGHSLGGSVVTAYATWDFGGRAGADDLAGLVYIDGGERPGPMSAQTGRRRSCSRSTPRARHPGSRSAGSPRPTPGCSTPSGSAAALLDPNGPSLGQTSGLLPAAIVPPVPVTNVGQYGYALNVATSPSSLVAAQAHLGRGSRRTGPVHGWDGTGALTPITRYATMFSGAGMHERRRHRVVLPAASDRRHRRGDNGNANPAQSVLGVDATMGHDLPRSL